MTVQEIKNKEFIMAKRGYDQDEVRRYLHQVASQIETLEAEKANLIKKLEVLARKVEEYKKDEESIQGALLGAQKLAKTTISEAKEKAEALSREAKTRAEELVMKTKTESEKISSEAKAFSQEVVGKARAEADKIVNEAKINVENTLRTSRYEIEKEQTNLLRTQKEVSKFKKELLDIYRTHIDLIQRLPESGETANDEKEVRELKNNIYRQKSDTKEETVAEPQNAASEDPLAEELAKVAPVEETTMEPSVAEEPPKSYTEEIAPENTVQLEEIIEESAKEEKKEAPITEKFQNLQFGSNS